MHTGWADREKGGGRGVDVWHDPKTGVASNGGFIIHMFVVMVLMSVVNQKSIAWSIPSPIMSVRRNLLINWLDWVNETNFIHVF